MSMIQLTHWGRVTHICVSKLTTIGSDNGLSPGPCQAIIWTNAGILLIGPLGTNFSEILIVIEIFSFKKMHLKISSAKWRPFCFGLNVLTHCGLLTPYGKISLSQHWLIIHVMACCLKQWWLLNGEIMWHSPQGIFTGNAQNIYHDDVIKWKHFPHYWPFVRGIHWSPVNTLHKKKQVTQDCDVLFDLRLNKPLRKQSWDWWFEMPSCSLWHHCNVFDMSWKFLIKDYSHTSLGPMC